MGGDDPVMAKRHAVGRAKMALQAEETRYQALRGSIESAMLRRTWRPSALGFEMPEQLN